VHVYYSGEYELKQYMVLYITIYSYFHML